ncbi:hypothetical protein [Nakamurella panacisegetis]|uniref:hypothetical protein n=1 Tax=Nakamurella panacisegetis TaxID=1090615 RepID=UPI0012FD1BFD|nr:hypothetical protein [Nakamurella panacisegetis]
MSFAPSAGVVRGIGTTVDLDGVVAGADGPAGELPIPELPGGRVSVLGGDTVVAAEGTDTDAPELGAPALELTGDPDELAPHPASSVIATNPVPTPMIRSRILATCISSLLAPP